MSLALCGARLSNIDACAWEHHPDGTQPPAAPPFSAKHSH